MSLSKIITTEGLIMYIDSFNEKSYDLDNNKWYDISGNKNSGDLIGNIKHIELPLKTFINNDNFNSKNYLTVDNPIVFNNGDEYSLDFYIKLNPNSEYNRHSIVGNGTNKNFITIDYIRKNRWDILLRDNNGEYIQCAKILDYDLTNDWCNIVITVNKEKELNVYINGTFVQKTKLPNSSELTISRIMGGFEYIGKYQSFEGMLSNIRIYNKEITQEEIIQNISVLGWRYAKIIHNDEN